MQTWPYSKAPPRRPVRPSVHRGTGGGCPSKSNRFERGGVLSGAGGACRWGRQRTRSNRWSPSPRRHRKSTSSVKRHRKLTQTRVKPLRTRRLSMARLAAELHWVSLTGGTPGRRRRVARRRRGCPRLVHGANPLQSTRRCGQGVGNPISTSARATPVTPKPTPAGASSTPARRLSRGRQLSPVIVSTWLFGARSRSRIAVATTASPNSHRHPARRATRTPPHSRPSPHQAPLRTRGCPATPWCRQVPASLRLGDGPPGGQRNVGLRVAKRAARLKGAMFRSGANETDVTSARRPTVYVQSCQSRWIHRLVSG